MRPRGLACAVLLAAAAAIDTEDAPEQSLRECGRPSSARRQLEHDCVGDLTECRRSVGACELRSKPLLICVHNSPFEALGVLAPLQLFDVQTVVVRGRLGGVRTVRASDDSAVHAAVAAYRHGGAVNHTLTMLGNAGAGAGWMTDGAGALAGAWELFFSTVAWATEPAGGAQPPKATSETLRVAFSPYGTSCVALSLGGGVARVEEIELARERMVVSIAQPRERRPKLPWDELPLGVRPCVVVAAAVLFQLAAPLAHSIFFHYAGGVTLSMVLGIFILAYFAAGWVPGRRKTVVLVAATGWLGATYAALTHLVALYWHWVVAYCAFFGAVGYFLTFYVTRGGGARPCDPSLPRPPRPPARGLLSHRPRTAHHHHHHPRAAAAGPEEWQCAMLERMIKLVAVGVLGLASSSLRGRAALVATALSLWVLPATPVGWVWLRCWRWLAEPRAAPPPQHFVDDSGRRRRYRPPTTTGRYLSAEEYETQTAIATQNAMDAYVRSPDFQRWFVANHGRVQVEAREGEERHATEE